jgi:large subunit ribosomal protein L18
MQVGLDRRKIRQRVRYRIRKKVSGTAERPRLAVFRSLKHIYAQAIDDELGRTLAESSSCDPALRGELKRGSDVEAAKRVGAAMAAKLKASGVEAVVFDRGGFLYHGRVKALADALREGGVRF